MHRISKYSLECHMKPTTWMDDRFQGLDESSGGLWRSFLTEATVSLRVAYQQLIISTVSYYDDDDDDIIIMELIFTYNFFNLLSWYKIGVVF